MAGNKILCVYISKESYPEYQTYKWVRTAVRRCPRPTHLLLPEPRPPLQPLLPLLWRRKSFRWSSAQWKLFTYNLTTGEFLGHPSESWDFILLFYPIFYGFLAALLTFTIRAMLQTLKWWGSKSLLCRLLVQDLRFNKTSAGAGIFIRYVWARVL